MTKQYNDNSIDLLIGARRVRKRAASMLGSSGLDGARHGFTEIYGNALDEKSAGYGDKLEVHYYKNGAVSVRDYGRGVPLGWNEKHMTWNWHVVYNELYGGGKYDNGQWYLRGIGNYARFSLNDIDFVKGFEANVTPIKDIPTDGEFHSYADIDAKIDGNDLVLRVNNQTWDTVTWEFLNRRLNYLASVGLNGLGAASTQYTSEFFTVKSYRDGKVTSRSYKNGYPLVNGEQFDMFAKSLTAEQIRAIPEEIEDTDEPNGTFIYWKPDSLVFSDVNIGGDWLIGVCKDIAKVANIELHFVDDNTGRDEIYSAGNISELFAEDRHVLTSTNFSHGDITVNEKPFTYVAHCDVALTPTKENAERNTVSCHHNYVHMNSGVQYSGVNDAIVTFLKSKAKLKGYTKLEERDYLVSFDVVVSTQSNYASFRGQTKDGIDDTFIYTLVYNAVAKILETEYAKGNPDIVNVVESVIQNAEVRETIKMQEKIVRESKKVTREKEPEKFVSCDAYENKQYDKAELWIVEGDSAMNGIKKARDKTFQAIYPVRGKGLNVAKAGYDRILANKEIREIFALLGTGFDISIKGMESHFDMSKLRFNKIIFGTDADEDGYQIRVLLFLTIYKLAPRLITEGHVFIGETPRFRIELHNGEVLYARNDAERDKILNKRKGNVKKVSRFKGLGEVNADILSETTIHPDTRNLIPLNCDFSNDIECDFIDALFGADKYKQRKGILTAVLGKEVADMMEENALILESIDSEDIEDDTEIMEVDI